MDNKTRATCLATFQQNELNSDVACFTVTLKPVNNLICCKTGLMWGVKRATLLFNLKQKCYYHCKTETTCNNPVFDKYLLCTCAKSGNPWILHAPNLHLAMQSLTT